MGRHQRLARLIEMVSVIRYHPTWGPKKLAGYFEISEKRIYDDINELNAANIPVVFNGKGYSLLTPHSLPPVQFTIDEAMALLIGASALENRGEAQVARGASTKLLEMLPDNTRRLLLELSGRMKVEPKGRPAADPALKLLSMALAEHRTVVFYYESVSSKPAVRRVDPYGIVFRGNAWYLIGRCHMRSGVRTFRLNRITALNVTGDVFSYPGDFSIEEHLDNSWQIFQGDETEVVVRFSKKVAPFIEEHQWQPHQKIEKDRTGSIIYTTVVKGTLEIKRWILSWGEHAEVIAPDLLREDVEKTIGAMKTKYSAKSAGKKSKKKN